MICKWIYIYIYIYIGHAFEKFRGDTCTNAFLFEEQYFYYIVVLECMNDFIFVCKITAVYYLCFKCKDKYGTSK